MNNNGMMARDPTRPETPAFVKPAPRIDPELQGGMLSNPILFARLGRMPKKQNPNKRKGTSA